MLTFTSDPLDADLEVIGEIVPTAITMCKTRIEVFHDVAHPSAILLPV